MSLDLDPRQRAMLAEMGVRVWWPQEIEAADAGQAFTTADPATGITSSGAVTAYSERARAQFVSKSQERSSSPSATAPAPSARVESPPPRLVNPSPSTLGPLPSSIEQLEWTDLHQAILQCQACRMGLGRHQPVFVPPTPPQPCDWLVLGDPPDDPQERAALPFVEESGHLLDQMLKAVGVARLPRRGASHAPTGKPHQQAYLSNALKCRPALPTVPDAAALRACAHYLRREVALIRPKVILAMGRFALQMLLSEDHPEGLKLPLGKLRGQVWHFQGVPVVVTYPPAYLLRNGADKARAWQDLCLAADVAQGPMPPT